MAGNAKRIVGAFIGMPPWLPINLSTLGGVPVAGSCAPQWRFWPLLNSVELVGTLNVTGYAGGIGNGSFLSYPYRLPAPFHAAQIPICCQGNTVAPTQSPYLQIDLSGNPQIFQAPNSTTIVSFHGWYSLDG